MGEARWLRVISAPVDLARGVVWDGPVSAAGLTSVRRPDLLVVDTWMDGGELVRAELWELVDEPICARHETLSGHLVLTESWWRSLHASLAGLAAHSTDRVPRTQEQITVAMRRAYGPEVETRVVQWVTQHGDLRWTNLTARTPYLLDWEFWGLAPAGTDAATLYCTSLLVPELAAEIYDRFRNVLDTPDGRIAQLCVCIQIRRHGDCGVLDEPLRQLAERLIHGRRRR
ncbi:phosphotransferase [Acrocarpospora catenulata]|uniref:phosphotransferase n=1 Tax=Acrocarpospora catenulata TaxID=2836182 RepID=UPI001BD94A13|nr:phosphotransferase [Acrocarpospora catenulata]